MIYLPLTITVTGTGNWDWSYLSWAITIRRCTTYAILTSKTYRTFNQGPARGTGAFPIGVRAEAPYFAERHRPH